MSDDKPNAILNALEHTFHDAALKHMGDKLTAPEDWAKGRALIDKLHEDEERCRTQFEDHYDARVDQARAELRAGTRQLTLDLRGPRGMDGMSDDQIDAAAHLKVRQHHERDLMALKADFNDNVSTLLETAQSREQSRGKARDDFKDVSDTRAAPELSTPTRSR